MLEKRSIFTLLGLVASAAVMPISPAAAADLYGGSIKDEPAPPPICCDAKWSGLYIAGSVGYSIATTELSAGADFGPASFFGSLDGISGEGVTGTVTVGYDHEFGRGLVVGVFGDYTFGDVETDLTLGASYDGETVFSEKWTAKYEDTWSVGARVGLVRSCCTLWYIMGGYTETDLDLAGLDKESLSGYFVGGGVEQQLHKGWSLKLEYRFADYGETNIFNETFGESCESECQSARARVDLDSQVHSIRLGVAYKFNFDRGYVAEAPLK